MGVAALQRPPSRPYFPAHSRLQPTRPTADNTHGTPSPNPLLFWYHPPPTSPAFCTSQRDRVHLLPVKPQRQRKVPHRDRGDGLQRPRRDGPHRGGLRAEHGRLVQLRAAAHVSRFVDEIASPAGTTESTGRPRPRAGEGSFAPSSRKSRWSSGGSMAFRRRFVLRKGSSESPSLPCPPSLRASGHFGIPCAHVVAVPRSKFPPRQMSTNQQPTMIHGDEAPSMWLGAGVFVCPT